MPANEFLSILDQQIKDLNDAFAGNDAKTKRQQMLKTIDLFSKISDNELAGVQDAQLKKQLEGLRNSAINAYTAARIAILFGILAVVAVVLVVVFATKGTALLGADAGGLAYSGSLYATITALIISAGCIAIGTVYNSLIRSQVQTIEATLPLLGANRPIQAKSLDEFLISIKMLQTVFDTVNTLQPPVILNEYYYNELMRRNVTIPSLSGPIGIKDIFVSIGAHALKAVALGEDRGHYIAYRLASLGLVFSSQARSAVYSRGVALQQIGDSIRAMQNHSDEYITASIPVQYRDNFLGWTKRVRQDLGLLVVPVQTFNVNNRGAPPIPAMKLAASNGRDTDLRT